MNNITSTPDAVREYILRELPLVTTLFLKKIQIGDDDILQELFEADDITDMAESFFRDFNIHPAGFTPAAYFPWKIRPFFTRAPVEQDKSPLTIRMFMDSAAAGRWLF
ncbi:MULTISPECIES: DUF1493 family protein [unclassified Pantoea]|uniref:DUF1493 family protein n=1 Tax=unclassified Pantoea TaxID=2630326 RepID=UPI002269BFDB